MTTAKVLGAIGRVMITAGVLILLFVVYQLYGTGIRERQAQDRLERRFNALVKDTADTGDTIGSGSSSTTTSAPGGTTTTATIPAVTAPAEALAIAEGDPVGKIEVPRIGLTAYLVEGVAVDDLKEGPGHYPETPFPGQKGNVAVAGHRTTYGAPFANVDDLALGDTVTVTTVQGTFTYEVFDPQPDPAAGPQPWKIVTPDKVEVLQDFGDNRITLTACHPKYDLSHRIIVTAKLKGTPAPTPEVTPAAAAARKDVSLDLSGSSGPRLPVILYGLLCAGIWLAAWQLGLRWRKWLAYAIGLPFFLVALFFFFENFSRLLPSNY